MITRLLRQKPSCRALLLFAFILTCVLPSHAKDFTYGGIIYTALTDSTCETKQGSNSSGKWVAGNSVSGDIVIPDTVYNSDGKAYVVTRIGKDSFYNLRSLTSVVIPNSVVSIEDYAFQYCTVMKSIRIGSSVASIGKYAFEICMGVEELYIADSETELSVYDNRVFSSVTPTKVYLGRNLNRTIFTNNPKLSDLTIGDKVTTICSYAFDGCSALESVTIPESVDSIGIGAFKACTLLSSVTSRNPVPPTADDIFSDYTYLGGTLYVPVASVADYAAAPVWKEFVSVKAVDGSSSGISAIGDNSGARLRVENGAVCVEGGSDVAVVSVGGATVYRGRGDVRVDVAPGIYVVVVDNRAKKVAVN